MNFHIVTPLQRELATAHKQRLERLWPRPVVKVEPAPVVEPPPPAPIHHQMFKVAWDILEPFEKPYERITIDIVKREVCEMYGISKIEIESHRRSSYLVIPRQIAMYLAKTFTPRSSPEIARAIGGRDHTTVLYGVKKIEALLKIDPELADEIAELRRRLGA